MRFPVDFGRPQTARRRLHRGRCENAAERFFPRPANRLVRRIIGALGLLACAGILQGCSVLKLAYNQAPELAYRYLDAHLDFTSEQSVQVKARLHQLQAWHRQTQLPAYAGLLQQLQGQLSRDTTPTQACTVAADVRGKLDTLARQAEPLAASLAGSLDAGQLRHLAQKFAKDNAKEDAERLAGNPEARQEKRLQQALERAERLYGPLNNAQQALLARRLEQSRFDTRLSFAEKQRRQRDALTTLQPLTGGQASPEQALAAVRGMTERALVSPDPAYRAYLDQLGQDNCQSFADLHNSTSAAQRGQAVDTLRAYVQDIQTLSARKS